MERKPNRRAAIPRAVRDAVLKEFKHRCAICGRDRPQVHHVDENPGNSDPLNLLPLCPNCHLTDQHNPTEPVDHAKLALFRRFKDPTILAPEFEPLFARTRFLDQIESTEDFSGVSKSVDELVSFVNALAMGQFYGQQIATVLQRPSSVSTWTINTTEAELRRQREDHLAKYRKRLVAGRDEAIRLVVELLRYQPWRLSSPRRDDREL
jgi:hypothetical protein